MVSNELIEFGKRVKSIRRELDIAQKDFATKIGISGSFLSEVEKGKTKPGYEFFKNIILKIKVNPIYLYTGQGPLFMGKIPGKENENDDKLKIEVTEDKEIIEKMFWYFNKAPVVKYAVLEYFRKYIFQNKEMLDQDLKGTQPTEDKKNPE
jgi:transcriptional regulator with XRE-family HTH domain